MTEMPVTAKQEIELFYCYAHEDKTLRDELQANLAGLRHQYQLTNWHDQEIVPGQHWEEAISSHLSTADVILLLISPQFVNSDYCYGKEMQQALQRHHSGNCCVIPVLLRPTYWEETPLKDIQMLPTGAKPITIWSNRDEAFHSVARGINTAIKALLTSRKTNRQLLSDNTKLDQIAHFDPKKAALDFYTKGNSFFDQGQYEEALDAYDQAILLNLTLTGAHLKKGTTLHALYRYEEALDAYDQAILLNPNLIPAYMGKATSLSRLHRHEEALDAYDQIIRLNPATTDVYYRKGKMLKELGRDEEAEEVLKVWDKYRRGW